MRSTRQKSKSKILIILIVLTLLLAGSLISAILTNFYFTQAPSSSSTNPVAFTIQKGESVTQIAQKLYDQNLIKNPFFFKLTVKRLGLGSAIQAGNFHLNPGLSAAQIAQALTQAKSDQLQATLIEGWRREEMAESLAKTFAANPNFSQSEFLQLTQGQEGRLYPDTYFFDPDATTQTVVDTLLDTFVQKVTTPLATNINQSSYTFDQILVMASIIEREARGSARPLVAGILWKRYQNDWPLQADATLQYIKGYSKFDQTWWPNPLAADKEITSPYNTYQNTGLPPAPICNPSLDSIQAAINPTNSEYWYYITDNSGQMHYSTTYDQHLDNVNKYLR